MGGGCIFIYSGPARLVSLEIKLISKEVSRAEPEYMNIHPPPPISVLATALIACPERFLFPIYMFIFFIGTCRYSYDYGLVHFIMMSTEHDMGNKSTQYKWLENDLKKVNRTKTPWIILAGHRPMYTSELAIGDVNLFILL